MRDTKVRNTDSSEKVHDFLLTLKEFHSDSATDAQFSYELLAMGTKTKLTQDVEKIINTPLESISDMTEEFNGKIRSISERIANSFFAFNKKIIADVYKNEIGSNALHYSIVLVDDNIKNRSRIFEFFTVYDTIGFSSNFPIHFQFTPQELIEKIKVKEKVAFV